jgi:hypothetical protein
MGINSDKLLKNESPKLIFHFFPRSIIESFFLQIGKNEVIKGYGSCLFSRKYSGVYW